MPQSPMLTTQQTADEDGSYHATRLLTSSYDLRSNVQPTHKTCSPHSELRRANMASSIGRYAGSDLCQLGCLMSLHKSTLGSGVCQLSCRFRVF